MKTGINSMEIEGNGNHSLYCVFSFGGGVQSSAIYLMLINEPRKLYNAMNEVPGKIFFTDTGAELQSTYKCLEYMQGLRSPLFHIELVSNGNILKSNFKDTSNSKAPYPFFIKNGQTGKVGMAQRMCTHEYKIKAVQKATKDAFKLNRIRLQKGIVSMWLGISMDEIHRMKDNRDHWRTNRYPLIEMGMTRQDCIEYCAMYNWLPTKSRCYFCPYQSNASWNELKQNSPKEFELACKEDELIRNRFLTDGSKSYLHKSCIPLKEINFKRSEIEDGFNNECEGVCNT